MSGERQTQPENGDARAASGLSSYLLDPRPTTWEMPVKRAGRTPKLLRHLRCRHVAGYQHRLKLP